jgi:ABC-type nitrate/sulfonate/bicarbonate transport system substrate-binding protein
MSHCVFRLKARATNGDGPQSHTSRIKRDGIQITWSFLRGAGPATNELYANGLADFSLLGDLPSIIGHSGGLKTRVLAATAIRGNTYISFRRAHPSSP